MEYQTQLILDALELMDATDDEQWTNDGAPKVETVAALSGIEGLKRADIISASPEFSRTNTESKITEEVTEEVTEESLNTMGYQHPEILDAQADYDAAVVNLAEAKEIEAKYGLILTEVTDRLMRKKKDRQANQRGIMAVIQASNKARAARVTEHNKTRAMLSSAAPKSALDEAKAGEKKVRPLMTQ